MNIDGEFNTLECRPNERLIFRSMQIPEVRLKWFDACVWRCESVFYYDTTLPNGLEPAANVYSAVIGGIERLNERAEEVGYRMLQFRDERLRVGGAWEVGDVRNMAFYVRAVAPYDDMRLCYSLICRLY